MNLLTTLVSLLTPTFLIEQAFPTVQGETRTLCIGHVRGQGYAVYETRTECGETSLVSETYEDGLTRTQAYEAAVQSGARPETLQALRQCRSLVVDAVPLLVLEVHTAEGVFRYRLQDHTRQSSFLLQVLPVLLRHRHDPLTALIGRVGEHEVAWQNLFVFMPWGAGCVRAIQRVLNA
ncbi:hypothetical protein [Deinococcus aluminii]|uniref:Uncharacterized protein n=1 Tax=Deinococcus aluminii TaxID=1656885 RepID=A0ABP9XEV1_9DEIO